MRRAVIVVAVLSALLLVTACEPKDGHVYFRNNSDQTLTLRQIRHDDTSPTGTRYFYAATAAAGTTADLRDHPREGFCLLNWEIVDQSGQVLGLQAARLLIERIDGRQQGDHFVVSPRLVVRGSSRPRPS